MDKFGWTFSMAIASVLMYWVLKYGGVGAGALSVKTTTTPSTGSTTGTH